MQRTALASFVFFLHVLTRWIVVSVDETTVLAFVMSVKKAHTNTHTYRVCRHVADTVPTSPLRP